MKRNPNEKKVRQHEIEWAGGQAIRRRKINVTKTGSELSEQSKKKKQARTNTRVFDVKNCYVGRASEQGLLNVGGVRTANNRE